MIGVEEGKIDGVVMVTFVPEFTTEKGVNASAAGVADHIEHISNLIGKKHVGIGSDFDGIGATIPGLHEASKYPYLFAELYSRGWKRHELVDLAGGNFLRVFEGVERVAKQMQASGVGPSMARYSKRPDMAPPRTS